jgi:hypothetical protein
MMIEQNLIWLKDHPCYFPPQSVPGDPTAFQSAPAAVFKKGSSVPVQVYINGDEKRIVIPSHRLETFKNIKEGEHFELKNLGE